MKRIPVRTLTLTVSLIARSRLVAVALGLSFVTSWHHSLQAQTRLPDFSAATFSHPLRIDNPYHPLAVGQIRRYEAEELDTETGETEIETIEVATLNATRMVAGIEARVVRDRVYNSDDQIIEDTFDWFAQDDAGNVWYMGEAVTDYHYDDDGNLTGTTNPGQWEAGVDGAAAGILMPADLTIGDAYYQEFYAGEAEDEGAILAVGLTYEVSNLGGVARTFTDVLQTSDATALDPMVLEHKYYAAGIGKIGTTKFLDGVDLGGERLSSFVVPEPQSGWLLISGILLLSRHRFRNA